MRNGSDLRIVSAERRFEPLQLAPVGPTPHVSVLLTSYNHASYVTAAIKSVLGQSYHNWELLICDDGSTDNSVEQIGSYVRRDSRVHLFVQSNQGQAAAWNHAFRHASGEVICLLDSDDEYHPHKIERVVNALRCSPNSGMCVHRVQPISAYGKRAGRPMPVRLDSGWMGLRTLLSGGATSLPPTTGLSFRREIASRLFPAPAEYRTNGDFYLRMAGKLLTQIATVDESLAGYRLHGKNALGVLSADPDALCDVLECYEATIEHVRRLLAATYGTRVANLLDLDDAAPYWQAMLSLYILAGKAANVRQCSLSTIRIKAGRSRRARLLGWIAAAPAPVGVLLLRAWKGTRQNGPSLRRLVSGWTSL